MRFVAPSSSSLTLSASQKARSHARESRREGLARIPEDGSTPRGVLASVVSSHRLRAQATSTNLLRLAPAPNSSQKRPITTHLMNGSLPFGKVSFCEWYETLTLEKRRALMLSMIEVCKERGKSSISNSRSNMSSGDCAPIDPNETAFKWRVEGDGPGEDSVLQFTKWYTALDEAEQDTALAYSGLADGEKVADLPTEEELERANKENEQVAKPLTKESSFVEGSSSRSTPRDGVTDQKSIAAKGKMRRLTREASSQVFTWATSFVQHKPLVVPTVPVTQPTQAPAVAPRKDTDSQSNYVTLPKPPKSGYRAKLTRNGTVVVDDRGRTIFEKIPADILYPQRGRTTPT